MNKIALITGITGQDGAYLADFLLEKGYEVHGLRRRVSLFNTDRIDHLINSELFNKKFFLHYGDLTDSSSITNIIQKVRPDEIYNLAAQSHVAVSFEEPEYTANSDGLGVLRILESIRILHKEKNIVFEYSKENNFFSDNTLMGNNLKLTELGWKPKKNIINSLRLILDDLLC